MKFKLPDLSSKNARKRAKIILLISLASFVGILTLTFSYFTTSGSCTILCHSMRPQEASWKKSAHKNIPCMSCHAPPGGAVALTLEHIVASRFIPMEFVLGYHKPINSESEVSTHIEDERCYRCHNLETRKVTPTPGLNKMTSEAHLKHLDAGLHCTTCHNRVTHKAMDDGEIEYDKGEEAPDFKYKDFMQMKEGCLRCHSGEDTYKAKNGAVAPTACTACHPNEWEGLPLGHGKEWRKKEHGQLARQNFGYCLGNSSIDGKMPGCHAANATFNYKDDQPLCKQCHDSDAVKEFVSLAGSPPVDKSE